MKKAWKDKLKGGKADKKKPSDFDSKKLSEGKAVEREHVSDPKLQTEIAMDHLAEDRNYYKKLKTIHKSESQNTNLAKSYFRTFLNKIQQNNTLLEKGLKGDWQKEGYTLDHKINQFDDDPKDHQHRITVKTPSGDIAAHFIFENKNNNWTPSLAQVGEAHQRKGIATGVYNYFQQQVGQKIVPHDKQSPDAQSLWSQPSRAFGKTEELIKALPAPRQVGETSPDNKYVSTMHSDNRISWYSHPHIQKSTDAFISRNKNAFISKLPASHQPAMADFISKIEKMPTRHAIPGRDSFDSEKKPRARHIKALINNEPHVTMSTDNNFIHIKADRHGDDSTPTHWRVPIKGFDSQSQYEVSGGPSLVSSSSTTSNPTNTGTTVPRINLANPKGRKPVAKHEGQESVLHVTGRMHPLLAYVRNNGYLRKSRRSSDAQVLAENNLNKGLHLKGWTYHPDNKSGMVHFNHSTHGTITIKANPRVTKDTHPFIAIHNGAPIGRYQNAQHAIFGISKYTSQLGSEANVRMSNPLKKSDYFRSLLSAKPKINGFCPTDLDPEINSRFEQQILHKLLPQPVVKADKPTNIPQSPSTNQIPEPSQAPEPITASSPTAQQHGATDPEETVAPLPKEPTRSYDLLTDEAANAKTAKSGARGDYLSAILHLAPADLAGGKDMCPFATEGCRHACLNTSGRGGMLDKEYDLNEIQLARIRKTKEFQQDPHAFLGRLAKDISKTVKYAQQLGRKPVIRLNGTSDVNWAAFKSPTLGGKTIFEAFPDVQFYDYTKNPNIIRNNKQPNYHVTFSYADGEKNHEHAKKLLEEGFNVATVFGGKKPGKVTFPPHFHGKPVVSGDEHDLRFLDPKGVVVGLSAKSDAMYDTTGFVQWGHAGEPDAKPRPKPSKDMYSRIKEADESKTIGYKQKVANVRAASKARKAAAKGQS